MQQINRQTTPSSHVSRAVLTGLSQRPKSLPSWLLYDEHGDRLFQNIMELPEYYPTRCEIEIFSRYKDALLNLFTLDTTPFRLIELGAGDGRKTQIMLEALLRKKIPFEYVPVDISANALNTLGARLKATLPTLRVRPTVSDYLKSSDTLEGSERKVVLFLGSNIGNYDAGEAAILLRRFSKSMHSDDLILIGVDLKKDPRTVLSAYDDSRGVTAEFNMNVLRRINRELEANFDTGKFAYYPTYDPNTGEVQCYLVSQERQHVLIRSVDRHFEFNAWEPLKTEISRKFSLGSFQDLLERSGLEIVEYFLDEAGFFADVAARRRL